MVCELTRVLCVCFLWISLLRLMTDIRRASPRVFHPSVSFLSPVESISFLSHSLPSSLQAFAATYLQLVSSEASDEGHCDWNVCTCLPCVLN